MFDNPGESAAPEVTRLEGEGLHYQKTRQHLKPWSRTCAAGITAIAIIGLLVVLSLLIDYMNFSSTLRAFPGNVKVIK